jgi:predicted porin
MKKSAMTLAVLALAAAAGGAQAQTNVQVYGLLDMGVENANNKSPAAAARPA